MKYPILYGLIAGIGTGLVIIGSTWMLAELQKPTTQPQLIVIMVERN